MSWVYIKSESAGQDPESGRCRGDLFTVGFYAPDGTWNPESDHKTRESAAARVAYLNGAASVNQALGEALNSGDGCYRP